MVLKPQRQNVCPIIFACKNTFLVMLDFEATANKRSYCFESVVDFFATLYFNQFSNVVATTCNEFHIVNRLKVRDTNR